MKIMLVCPECNNTSFRIKQPMGFFKKKLIDINNDNYYMQEVICNKCHSVYFMGSLNIGLAREKEEEE